MKIHKCQGAQTAPRKGLCLASPLVPSYGGGPFPTPSPFLSLFPAVPADTGLPPPVPTSKVGGKLIFNWVSRIAVTVIVPFPPSAALMINTQAQCQLLPAAF